MSWQIHDQYIIINNSGISLNDHIGSQREGRDQHTLLCTVPEEGFCRDGADEPLKQFARSLPAVVDFCQVGQQSIQSLAISVHTLLLSFVLLLLQKYKESVRLNWPSLHMCISSSLVVTTHSPDSPLFVQTSQPSFSSSSQIWFEFWMCWPYWLRLHSPFSFSS